MYKICMESGKNSSYQTICSVRDMGDCYEVSAQEKSSLYLNKDMCVEHNNVIKYKSDVINITLCPLI